MTLSELLEELRKHMPHVGIVCTGGAGELAILTGFKYPPNAAATLESIDTGSVSLDVLSAREIASLRSQGYAVCVFTRSELEDGSCTRRQMEDYLAEKGNELLELKAYSDTEEGS